MRPVGLKLVILDEVDPGLDQLGHRMLRGRRAGAEVVAQPRLGRHPEGLRGVGHEPSPIGRSGIDFWGSSHVLGPQGEFLAEASVDAPQVLMAEVDLRRSEDVRRIWPFLRDRRIDSYAAITKRMDD